MQSIFNYHPLLFHLLVLLSIIVPAAPAKAQVTEVVVGVTPSCPYGIKGCWSGAYGALGRLEGVASVAKNPDAYNSTAEVYFKGPGLPDVKKWSEQFKSIVGEIYVFRGVEVTILASIEEKNGNLVLRMPGFNERITLAPLQNKLQWNFKKGAARQPEPDERKAYRKLAAKKNKAKGEDFQVEVTGPLRQTDQGLVLEVREFFLISPEAKGRRQD